MAAPRKRRFWWIALVVILALVLLGPTIISLTPARDAALARLLPADAGKLTARGASLGWSGPLALDGVELHDAGGVLVFSAERIELASGLLQLALNGAGDLNVRIAQPALDLQLSPAGTNLDPIIAALQKRKEEKEQVAPPGATETPRRLSVTVTSGRARLTDTATGEQWIASDLEAAIDHAAAGVDALEVTVAGKIAVVVPAGAQAGPNGEFNLRLGAAQEGGRLARVKAASLPLSVLGPLVRRNDPSAAFYGWVNVEGDASWRPDAMNQQASGPLDPFKQLLAGSVVSSGRVLFNAAEYRGAATGGAPLPIGDVEVPWRVAAAGDRLRIDQFEAVSSIGAARAVGTISQTEVDAWRGGASLPPSDLRVAAQLDLGQLAAIAPSALRLREGVRIDSGSLRAELTGLPGEAGPRLVGSMRTEGLIGASGGKQIAWREPLDVRFDVTQRDAERGLVGWTIDSVNVESAFFNATASGGADRIQGNAKLDLDRLAAELSQFVDLGGVRLAGSGDTRFTFQQNQAGDRWRLESTGSVERLFVGQADRPLVSEPKLDFRADLRGVVNAATPPTGQIDLSAGADTLSVQLAPSDGATAPRPFEASIAGDLANWYRRARLASPRLPDQNSLRIAGRIEASATGSASERGGKLDRINVVLPNLAVDTAGATPLRIREERVELKGEATWDSQTGVVQSNSVELAANTISMRARGIRFDPRAANDLRGEVVYRADVGRIMALASTASGKPPWVALGQATGSAILRGAPEGLLVDFKTTADGLRLFDQQGAAPREVWREPQLKINLQAIVESIAAQGSAPATAALDLRDMRVESSMLNGSGGGRIEDLAAMRGVRLGGGIDYDLEKLTPLLWPRLGDGVRLIGKERATFQIASEGSSDDLRARFEAPWQGADLLGLPVGPGRLAATFEQGILRTDPLKVAVGQGELTTQVSATLKPPPQSLSLAPGPLVTNVDVSREVSERFLKFIAPVLADATRIDGRYSLSFSEFAMPLGAKGEGLRRGRAAGVMTIHAVEVAPGPSVAEWVAMAKQVRSVARDGVEGAIQPSTSSILTIRDQKVEFQLADGRVYHRGLTFNIGDAIVRSEGSVGVDETLDLLLSVPILDEWIEERPELLGRMRGKSLRIPIRGTFSQPQIDRDAFQQLSRDLIQSAASGAIDTGINLLLERLRSR